jgi:hypothetical protein
MGQERSRRFLKITGKRKRQIPREIEEFLAPQGPALLSPPSSANVD